ncbi:MAG: stage 0 sporulation family protein [Chloroflexi bacterium]|nr:stage 0 sporulation family protein [Chloroflexota bacterium]
MRFQTTGKLYDFDARAHRELQPGDFVLVETARGQQLGQVVNMRPLNKGESRGLKPIRRQATGRDLALRQHWRDKEDDALAVARKMAAQLNLTVKVIVAEYTFDGKRLTLLYVSEKKKLNVDGLIKRLQKMLNVRVDMRRVGPRDHAKLLGGYGACGEQRCCSRYMAEFCPVSIKMAKAQGISLNPSDITGMCGRLRCCLVYEHEQYAEASKKMPRRKKRVRTPHGEGRVVDLLPLKGMVVVQIEDRRIEVPAEDVELITS